MLFDASEEDPRREASASSVGPFAGFRRVKRPQMQWNRLVLRKPDDPMFAHLRDSKTWMYFVHSLHGVPDDGHGRGRGRATTAARSTPRSVRQRVRHPVHPEKSGPLDCSFCATSPGGGRRHFVDGPVPASTYAADGVCVSSKATRERDHLRQRPGGEWPSRLPRRRAWIHVVDLDAARPVIR